jgi:hypothetical protein
LPGIKNNLKHMKTNFMKFNAKKLTRKQQKRVWILFLAKLGFQKLAPTDKVTKARQIVDAMTGNPNYPTPTPTLAAVGTAADTLYDAQQALDGTAIKTAERNVAEAALDSLMSTLLAYVNTIAGKDVVKILSAGFEVRDPNTKATKLDPPVELTSSATKVEGEIKVTFKAIKKKTFYVVQVAEDVAGDLNWMYAAESTKATIILEDLVPGQKYRIRVAVANTAGLSGWSEEISGRPI